MANSGITQLEYTLGYKIADWEKFWDIVGDVDLYGILRHKFCGKNYSAERTLYDIAAMLNMEYDTVEQEYINVLKTLTNVADAFAERRLTDQEARGYYL